MDFNDRITCHRAIESRDARFDGHLFIGVTSTGIYCRPICPARTPRVENCRFYPSAAAAQQDGFRPCLRCRPESAPGGGTWRGSSETVSRALALLAESGPYDEPALGTIAARLGVSMRQLRRLFQQHLGASPVSVLQTRRILVAKQLIHETRLPMTAVAMAAGFGSVRRFNETFQAMYRRPPSMLRRRTAAPEGTEEEIVLRLRYHPPYDWAGMLAAHAALPGVSCVSGGEYRRGIRSGSVRVWHDAPRHNLNVGLRLDDIRMLPETLSRVARAFDTAADIAAINAHLATDPLLAPLVAARPGLRPAGAWDTFEAAVLALLPAGAIAALLDLCAPSLPSALQLPGVTRLFPGAACVLAADLSTLPVTPHQRTALRALAQDTQGLPEASDAFDCADPALAARSAAWRPWRAYAARHLHSAHTHPNEETS